MYRVTISNQSEGEIWPDLDVFVVRWKWQAKFMTWVHKHFTPYSKVIEVKEIP